ncbi:MAG: hypothetical protein K6C05_06365 [Anaerovibrio sp.]|uniref:hypothetical protein n=1 Tax=Anaerovibrio sp. TaxID=1872532 RepID=UPI0025EA1E8D|nr:hypothetical protein [Anaerovibrio sp.]MCR5176461.1 hypothetical protein [Anaerovibrio sp.]
MGNTERAKALMEDLQEYAPEKAKMTTVDELEVYLDSMEQKVFRYMEFMSARIPRGLPAGKYQREINWLYRQVRKMINDEISQMYH